MEQIKISGRLRTKVYENGVLIQDDTSDNMVVTRGLTALSKLMGGDDPAMGKPVDQGQVGTSAAVPAAGERSSLFIFIDSITSNTWPLSTTSPEVQRTSTMEPVMGAVRRETPAGP